MTVSSYPPGLPKRLRDIWDETSAQLGPEAPDSACEAYCAQVWLMRDADRRVAEEGVLISNAKGDAIPHPAIAIAQKAAEELRKWAKEFPPLR